MFYIIPQVIPAWRKKKKKRDSMQNVNSSYSIFILKEIFKPKNPKKQFCTQPRLSGLPRFHEHWSWQEQLLKREKKNMLTLVQIWIIWIIKLKPTSLSLFPVVWLVSSPWQKMTAMFWLVWPLIFQTICTSFSRNRSQMWANYQKKWGLYWDSPKHY